MPVTAVRLPAVAGTLYPAEPTRLARLVDALLEKAGLGVPTRTPMALVVPHAGYQYSGAVAARGYGALRGVPALRRIVIAGPAHFVPLRGAAVPAAQAWSTPLGVVPVTAELREIAISAGAVQADAPHALEHAIEVQLPFLQRLFPEGLSILPVAVGDAPHRYHADLMSLLRDEADLLVVSTDLSHYHPDDVARRLDRHTVDAIVALDSAAIVDAAACGVHALRGVVEWARRRGAPVTVLEQRTSADAGGGRDRVVGYAAIAIG
jgi:hypothetical protein